MIGAKIEWRKWCEHTKGKQTKYSPEALLAAVTAVKTQKMKRSAAAGKFNVPATTIYDNISGRHSRIGAGAPTILSPAEESEIVVSYASSSGNWIRTF